MRLLGGVKILTVLCAVSGGAFAQEAVDLDGIERGEGRDISELSTCSSVILKRPVEFVPTQGREMLLKSDMGAVFVSDASCSDGKLVLNGVIMIDNMVKPSKMVGSAIKSDSVIVQAAPARENCPHSMDLGIEARNLRWFNWDERVVDGGNKSFEIVRDAGGQEIRINTISHFRAADLVWSATPKNAVSPCSLSGDLALQNFDSRVSMSGTAFGVKAAQIIGSLSSPVFVDDARSATGNPALHLSLVSPVFSDIAGADIMSTNKFDFSTELSPQSALPWSLFLGKYTRPALFRTEDTSLLSRILPVDLSNALYFTRATTRFSASDLNLVTAALVPGGDRINLGSVNLSNVIANLTGNIQHNANDVGQMNINMIIAGVADVKGTAFFRTQRFNKDMLSAISAGQINVNGLTGPGLTAFSIKMKDQGWISAFQSLFKNLPSRIVMRSAQKDLEQWNKIGSWLGIIEGGKTGQIDVSLIKPQLMTDGFMNQALQGAQIEVRELAE